MLQRGVTDLGSGVLQMRSTILFLQGGRNSLNCSFESIHVLLMPYHVLIGPFYAGWQPSKKPKEEGCDDKDRE